MKCHKTIRSAAAVLVSALCVGRLNALHPAVRHYGRADGLPQIQVTALAQDSRGFLWIGTSAGGVGRYDGRSWAALGPGAGLPTIDVLSLAMSPEGTLYVGTTGGAARLRGERWEPLPGSEGATGQPVLAIHAESDHEVWLGTSTGLFVWRSNGSVQPIETPAGPVGAEVWEIAPSGDGSLWLATGHGVFRVGPPPDPAVVTIDGLPPGPVKAVLPRDGGTIIAAVAGQGLFAGSSGRFRRLGDDLVPGRSIEALLASRNPDGGIWIATSDRGAFRFRDQQWEAFGPDEGLSTPIVFGLLEDREGVLWLGTDDGLFKRYPSAFLSFGPADGIPAEVPVYGMAETVDGSLWLAAWHEGALFLGADGTSARYGPADGLPDAPVSDVIADSRGVLVCTLAGLARIDGGRCTTVELPKGVSDDLRTGLVGPRGGLFLATFHDGLYRLGDVGAERISGPVGDDVAAVAAANNGGVWCGGAGWGAALLDGTRVAEHLTTDDGLPSNHVQAILEDSSGTVWIATDRGVWTRDSSGVARVLERSSPPGDDFVYWIAEDRDGARWFGTNHGVVRRLADGTWNRYTAKDGLGHDECNEGGVLVDSRGRLLVGTAGVSVFAGATPTRRPVAPPVYVDRVTVAGRTFAYPERVRLRAHSDLITLQYVSPSFTDENATRFRTRMHGLTEVWTTSEPGQQTTTFGGLPAGDLRFEVVAITGDGRVSAAPAGVTLEVIPRWWERSEARLLAALGILTAALLLIRTRDRRFRLDRQRLERLVSDRTQELRSANERLTKLAVTDELTGIANRRSILEELEATFAHAQRHGEALAVALLDLDHFKEVNDTLGHQAGDALLRASAEILRSTLRAGDRIGRYGGDEFLAVLPETNVRGAQQVFERMNSALAEARLGETVAHGTRLPCLSVSVGIAIQLEHDSGPEAMIHRADKALYLAKRRNLDEPHF